VLIVGFDSVVWCRSCHREVAAVSTSNGSVDCPFCGYDTQIRADESLKSENNDSKTSTKKRIRTDTSHLKHTSGRVDPKLVPREQRHVQTHQAGSFGTIASKSWINLVGFFVFIFLIGQGLTIWSFLAGHFGAWALGQTSIVFGTTAAFWLLIRQTATLADQNRLLAQRVNRIAKQLTDRTEPRTSKQKQAPGKRPDKRKNVDSHRTR